MGEISTGSTNGAMGKNIDSYAATLLNNKDLKVGQELKRQDGGVISIFVDAQGKTVGSINKESDGKIGNVAFESENGSSSYNDMDNNGTIDNIITQKKDNSMNGQDIGSLAKTFEDCKSFKVVDTLTAKDGGHIYIYADSIGRKVGSVNKDASEKVRNIAFDGPIGGFSSYNDMDKNGTIDNGFAKTVDIQF